VHVRKLKYFITSHQKLKLCVISYTKFMRVTDAVGVYERRKVLYTRRIVCVQRRKVPVPTTRGRVCQHSRSLHGFGHVHRCVPCRLVRLSQDPRRRRVAYLPDGASGTPLGLFLLLVSWEPVVSCILQQWRSIWRSVAVKLWRGEILSA